MSFRFNFSRLLPVVMALFLQGHLFAMQPNAVIAGLKTGSLQLAPEVPGGAIGIAVGGASGDIVWAVSNNAEGQGKAIYKLNGNIWEKKSGWAHSNAGMLAVGRDGSSWVVGIDSNVYQWVNNNWVKTPTGMLKQISVYEKNLVCGIGLDDRVYLTRDQGVNWQLLAGPSNRKFKWTTVVNNAQGYAVVWAVGQDRKLYRWPGGDWVVNSDGEGDKIFEVDATTILCINDTSGSCWLNNGMGGDGMVTGGWSQFYPAFQFGQISVTPNGKIWAVSKADGKVYSNSGILAPVANFSTETQQSITSNSTGTQSSATNTSSVAQSSGGSSVSTGSQTSGSSSSTGSQTDVSTPIVTTSSGTQAAVSSSSSLGSSRGGRTGGSSVSTSGRGSRPASSIPAGVPARTARGNNAVATNTSSGAQSSGSSSVSTGSQTSGSSSSTGSQTDVSTPIVATSSGTQAAVSSSSTGGSSRGVARGTTSPSAASRPSRGAASTQPRAAQESNR